MRWAWVVAMAACGPGLKRPDMREIATDVMVQASGNAAAIEGMLEGEVVDGGLWFADRACDEQFHAARKIEPDQFHAFAQCLATLHWEASPRVDALGDTIVLAYPPGFEIEARVVHENEGAHLPWIGYEARRDPEDAFPTVTPAALEALREAGDRGATFAADPDASAWFKVCIDETGAVTSAEDRETTSFEASRELADTIKTWKFRPFTVRDKVLPVCAMERLGHAAAKERLPFPAPTSRSNKRPIMIAPGAKLVEGHRVSGHRDIAPDDRTKIAIQNASLTGVISSFRICLDEAGHVESVLPIKSTGFADYDRTLIDTMQQWVYSPFLVDDQPVPVCTAVTFVYRQKTRAMVSTKPKPRIY
jgi:hypothetical protein